MLAIQIRQKNLCNTVSVISTKMSSVGRKKLQHDKLINILLSQKVLMAGNVH